ncbi:MAG: hypothetical protein H0W25_21175 [Acidimicrobiia bacterium]|nr:hypothetical protein [Acidimicrobiia bacterium]
MTVSVVLVFVTDTLNVTDPPGSGNDATPASFTTTIDDPTFVIVTVASSVSDTGRPSSSAPDAVTVSVCDEAGAPVTAPLNEQLRNAPGASDTAGDTSQVPWPSKLPYTSSVSVLIETGSLEVLVTVTLNETDPPGSGTDVGTAILSTTMLRACVEFVTVHVVVCPATTATVPFVPQAAKLPVYPTGPPVSVTT